MHQMFPKAAILAALLCSSATATATAQPQPAETPSYARVAEVAPGTRVSENRADVRALAGPAFPGSKRCRGDVEVAGVFGFDIRVRNGSCATAKRLVRGLPEVAREGRAMGRWIKGWRCRRVGAYYEGAYYRCNRHRTTFQFGLGV